MLNTLHDKVRELEEWKKQQQLHTPSSSSLLHHQSAASLSETHHPDPSDNHSAPFVLSGVPDEENITAGITR